MSGEKFPGLDAIRERAARPDGEKKKAGRKPKAWTVEELAKLPPSQRQRVLRTVHIVMAPDLAGEVRLQAKPRPGSLTLELIGDIVKGLASGGSVYVVAGALGVLRSTLDDWLKKGEDTKVLEQPGGELYGLLVESVARARLATEQAALVRIAGGGKGWQGRAWQLERANPREYGPAPRKLEHSGPNGGSIRIRPMSVELPPEIPDGEEAARGAALVATHSGHSLNGSSRNYVPPEEEPEAAREDPDDDL